ncbi:Hypothetical protein FKW44_014519, partial [Caligus rogercresseyi]
MAEKKLLHRNYSRRSFLQILSDVMKDASLDYATTKAPGSPMVSLRVSTEHLASTT